MTTTSDTVAPFAGASAYRLTQYAHGGGCACKIPPGELEAVVAGLVPWTSPDLLVGLETGDDAAVVRIDGDRAIVATTDFFTAVVDDAYDFGRIGAANALSDIYAMGATPLIALNLVGWPRGVLPMELLAEVLRGGMDVAREAQVHLAGGQSIDDPEPKYGMAVTGIADPARLLRNDAAKPGLTGTRRRERSSPRRSTAWSGSTRRPRAPRWPRASPRRRTSPASACWATASRWPAPPGSRS
jgi:selenophosphate synthase